MGFAPDKRQLLIAADLVQAIDLAAINFMLPADNDFHTQPPERLTALRKAGASGAPPIRSIGCVVPQWFRK